MGASRKLRRQIARQRKSITVSVSDAERMRIKEEAVDQAMVLLFALPVKVLHDEYGWGTRKRLPEFADALTREYQRFSDGEYTAQQYMDFVSAACGIRFEMDHWEER